LDDSGKKWVAGGIRPIRSTLKHEHHRHGYEAECAEPEGASERWQATTGAQAASGRPNVLKTPPTMTL